MKKSRIAMLVIAIVVICATVGVSFAAYTSSQIKDTITIGTGENVGIGVDTADKAYFAEELDEHGLGKEDDRARVLVPRGALVLKESVTGNFLDQNVSLPSTENPNGITNQIALMGKIKIRVSGTIVNKLNFTIKDIMCDGEAASDHIAVVILRNYTKTWHDSKKAYNKFNYAKGEALPVTENSMPYYLGAQWNHTTNVYEGGSKADIQTIVPLPVGFHEFTMLVYFKNDAQNTPSYSNSSITFNIDIAAI